MTRRFSPFWVRAIHTCPEPQVRVNRPYFNLIAREKGYTRVRARHLALLAQAPDLGTQGKVMVKREALHER